MKLKLYYDNNVFLVNIVFDFYLPVSDDFYYYNYYYSHAY